MLSSGRRVKIKSQKEEKNLPKTAKFTHHSALLAVRKEGFEAIAAIQVAGGFGEENGCFSAVDRFGEFSGLGAFWRLQKPSETA